MDILQKFNDATREMEAFENHPAKALEFEERLLYLNGLALVMNVDEDIDDREKEYLCILLNSFGMMSESEYLMDELIRFSLDPDKATIRLFVKTFRRRDIAKLFLFDALMMTRCDGRIADRETLLLENLVNKLEIPKGAYAEIYDLFCHIKHRDWTETKSFFSRSPVNVEYFQHLLDYHEVSLDDVLRDKAEALQDKLGFNWVEAKYDGDSLEKIKKAVAKKAKKNSIQGWYRPWTWGNDIATEPGGKLQTRKYLIAGPVTYAQFVRFLQFSIDSREINVADRKVMNKKGELLMDLDMAGIGYDPENRIFSCDPALNDKPVSGLTPLGATTFAESVRCSLGYGKKYKFSDSDVCFPKDDNGNALSNELIYTYKETYYLNQGRGTFIRAQDVCSLDKIVCRTDLLKDAVFRVMKCEVVDKASDGA